MRKKFLTAISAVFVLCACVGAAWADTRKSQLAHPNDDHLIKYQMDDVHGVSGSGGQWIAVLRSPDNIIDDVTGTGTGQPVSGDIHATRGGRTRYMPIKVEGNFVENRDYVYSYNGGRIPTPYNDQNDDTTEILPYHWWIMPVKHIFMVVPNTGDSLLADVRMRHYNQSGEQTTLDLDMGDPAFGYTAVKDASTYNKPHWKDNPLTNRFGFNISKTVDTGMYSTRRTYFAYNMNPAVTPSQSLNIPVIIANVADGNASVKPLDVMYEIREASSFVSSSDRGNLVAQGTFSWDATSDQNIDLTSTSDWVLVLADSKHGIGSTTPLIGGSDYKIKIDIKNYCGLRYALQRYDLMPDGADSQLYQNPRTVSADMWRMDLPSNVQDVDPEIKLDQLSHIAPGLITTYVQNFNIRTAHQKILRLYPVDGNLTIPGPHDLTVRLKQITGQSIGSRITVNNSGSASASVQAFCYNPFNTAYDTGFLTNVAARDIMRLDEQDPGWAKPKLAIVDPDKVSSASSIMGGDAVKADVATGDQVACVALNIPVPDDYQYRSDDASGTSQVGLLPLLVTFNLPKSHHNVSDRWDEYLDAWRNNGSIKDLFYRDFNIFATAHEDAKVKASDPGYDTFKNQNISRYLRNANAVNYSSVSAKTQQTYDSNVKVILDETQGRITVSFIVMLADSRYMNYGILNDSSATNGNLNFLAICDGHSDQHFDMMFDVRRVSSKSGSNDGDYNYNNNGGSGGGGGCSTGAAALLALCGAAAVCLRSKKGR